MTNNDTIPNLQKRIADGEIKEMALLAERELRLRRMSVLRADIHRTSWHTRFVPLAGVARFYSITSAASSKKF
jgi:hypothetical protein